MEGMLHAGNANTVAATATYLSSVATGSEFLVGRAASLHWLELTVSLHNNSCCLMLSTVYFCHVRSSLTALVVDTTSSQSGQHYLQCRMCILSQALA